jgi:hypothetical protein
LLAAVNVDRSDTDVLRLLDGIDAQAVIRLARRHRVATLLHERLRNPGDRDPSGLAAELRFDHLDAHARQLQAYETIVQLRRAITCPFLIIKGAAVAEQWYREPGVRTYVDVDVLVRRTDFRDVTLALIKAGFAHLLPNWDSLLSRGMAEVPMRHRACTVDLHWHLIARERPRHEILLSEAALFERARTITLGSVDVATLDREDTLLHLCINSGLDGGRRLLQLVDIDRVVRSGRVDWEVLADRAFQAGAQALCAAILQRCHHLIGTPLPAGLLAHLEPFRGWLRANTLINGHRRPDRRLFAGIASGILVASGRSTSTATIRSALTAAHEETRGRIARSRPFRPRTAIHSFQTDDGDDPRRRERYLRYLTWVDEQGPEASTV